MDKPHKNLVVWARSVDLVSEVYRMTQPFPEIERYGLVAQMRRAAISIASNIAEGAARNTRKEFINFLHVARGSMSELDTQLTICVRLGYVSQELADSLDSAMQQVDRLLAGLIRKLRSDAAPKAPR